MSNQVGGLEAVRSRITTTPFRHRKLGFELGPNIADNTETTDPGAVLIDTCSSRSGADSIPNESLFCLAKSRREVKRLCLAVTNALTGRARLHRSSADAFGRKMKLRTTKPGKIFNKSPSAKGYRKEPVGGSFVFRQLNRRSGRIPAWPYPPIRYSPVYNFPSFINRKSCESRVREV